MLNLSHTAPVTQRGVYVADLNKGLSAFSICETH